MHDKKVVKALLESHKETLEKSRIMERFFQRKFLVEKGYEKNLGLVQGEIKRTTEFIAFLEEILKE